MTGLAFPSDANFNREASYEDGTPISLNGDDIPIDPALTGAIDPLLMPQNHGSMKIEPIPHLNLYHQQQLQFQQQQHFGGGDLNEIDQVRQYSQGPQGDPFAPQMLVPYVPYEVLVAEQQHALPAAAKSKRKRKIRREEECGFCAGTDQRNKLGQPETMATCLECGRSGHPSCMELPLMGEALMSYGWRCIECKICELCHEKGEDDAILFCDRCDRGWHMYCFVPPITETPKGEWSCPQCPPIVPSQATPPPTNGMTVDQPMHPGQYEMLVEEGEGSSSAAGRTSSVASTSQSATASAAHLPEKAVVSRSRKGRGGGGKSRGRGSRAKPPPPSTPVGDDDDAMDVEVEPASAISKSGRSSRITKQQRAKMAALARGEEMTEEDEDAEPAPTPVRSRRRKAKEVSPVSSILPRVRLRLPSNQHRDKGKGKERDDDEGGAGHGMFDDILSEADRDTTKTQITRLDTVLFERSRQIAEEKLKPPPPPLPLLITAITTATTTTTSAAGRSTTSEIFDHLSTPGPSRPLRSAVALHQISTNVPATPTGLSSASPGPSTPGTGFYHPPHHHTSQLKLSAMDPNTLRIHTIRFGEYDIKTWYDAPFPEEYASIPDGRLWICEFCLKYMKSRFGALRHRIKCKARHPPGDEIYRDGVVSIFEVDGRRNKIYCQNLCLLSKMFLDHKSLFYDVEPFLFYVITELDDVGHRFVGYFSKEKRSPKDYNVSCIMTLPVRQRKGWGNLLIDFSYLLSKKEERTGSPEKPLSNLGAIGYRKYWTLAVMRYLQHAPDQVRLEDISLATSMTLEDICQILTEQNMLYVREPSPALMRPSPGQVIKFPKGRKNGVARRQLQRLQTQQQQQHHPKHPLHPHVGKDSPLSLSMSHSSSDSGKGPFVPPKHYEIHFEREKVVGYLKDWEAKGYLKLKPEKLQWTPYLLSRMTQQENGAAAAKGETPALAAGLLSSSSSTEAAGAGASAVVSPNGLEGEVSGPSSVALDLFSPPPEGEDDELPALRMGTRSRTRSPKKSPSKSSRKHKPSPIAAVVVEPGESENDGEGEEEEPQEMVTPRRLRGRQSQTSVGSAESERPPTTGRKGRGKRKTPARVEVEIEIEDLGVEEEEERPLRSSRSKANLHETPKKAAAARKRRRVASPELAEAEEAATEEKQVDVAEVVVEANGVHVEDATPSEASPQVEPSEISSSSAAAEPEEAEPPILNGHAESDVRSTLYFPEDEMHDEDAEGEEDADGEWEVDPDYS